MEDIMIKTHRNPGLIFNHLEDAALFLSEKLSGDVISVAVYSSLYSSDSVFVLATKDDSLSELFIKLVNKFHDETPGELSSPQIRNRVFDEVFPVFAEWKKANWPEYSEGFPVDVLLLPQEWQKRVDEFQSVYYFDSFELLKRLSKADPLILTR